MNEIERLIKNFEQKFMRQIDGEFVIDPNLTPDQEQELLVEAIGLLKVISNADSSQLGLSLEEQYMLQTVTQTLEILITMTTQTEKNDEDSNLDWLDKYL